MQLAEITQRRQLPKVKAETAKRNEPDTEYAHFLVDKNLFLTWCERSGIPVPRTVKVKKGGRLPGFHFQYPVLLKEAHGSGRHLCRTIGEVTVHAEQCKNGYQIQEYLLGFDFYRLCRDHTGTTVMKKVVEGNKTNYEEVTDKKLLFRIDGATRRLTQLSLPRLGVGTFMLEVAVRGETIYVISCRPDTHMLL